MGLSDPNPIQPFFTGQKLVSKNHFDSENFGLLYIYTTVCTYIYISNIGTVNLNCSCFLMSCSDEVAFQTLAAYCGVAIQSSMFYVQLKRSQEHYKVHIQRRHPYVRT